MAHDHHVDWQMPDGEPLFDFLERIVAEEAAKGPRFAEFDAAAPESCEGLLRTQAAFLTRHPHYAPRRLPPLWVEVFETWGQWQTFLAWACREAGMTHDFAERVQYGVICPKPQKGIFHGIVSGPNLLS